MAIIKDIVLPGRWRELSGGPEANITRIGRPGRWHLQDNDPYFVWMPKVTYRRSDFETQNDLRFDDIYAFFLVTKGFGFKVDDVFDNTHALRHGSGIIKQENGHWRLFKRYSLYGSTYEHPITRPKSNVVVSAGTLDFDTGIVTGIATTGTWTGGFYRPCIFQENGIEYTRNTSGIVEAVSVKLEEQLEIF